MGWQSIMREIKFRAFLKNHEIIVDIISMDFKEKIIYHENIQQDNLLDTEPASLVDPICFTKFKDCVIMQFTELKDKSRKEICEGDILFCVHRKFNKYISVEWCKNFIRCFV